MKKKSMCCVIGVSLFFFAIHASGLYLNENIVVTSARVSSSLNEALDVRAAFSPNCCWHAQVPFTQGEYITFSTKGKTRVETISFIPQDRHPERSPKSTTLYGRDTNDTDWVYLGTSTISNLKSFPKRNEFKFPSKNKFFEHYKLLIVNNFGDPTILTFGNIIIQ